MVTFRWAGFRNNLRSLRAFRLHKRARIACEPPLWNAQGSLKLRPKTEQIEGTFFYRKAKYHEKLHQKGVSRGATISCERPLGAPGRTIGPPIRFSINPVCPKRIPRAENYSKKWSRRTLKRILKGYHNVSRSRTFKKLIFPKYQDSTPIRTYSKICNSCWTCFWFSRIYLGFEDFRNSQISQD